MDIFHLNSCVNVMRKVSVVAVDFFTNEKYIGGLYYFIHINLS